MAWRELPPEILTHLADVGIADPDDGDVLTFDEATGTWVAAEPTGGGGGADLSDDEPLEPADPPQPGTSEEASRSDHQHPPQEVGDLGLSDEQPLGPADPAVPGEGEEAARWDHRHPPQPGGGGGNGAGVACGIAEIEDSESDVVVEHGLGVDLKAVVASAQGPEAVGVTSRDSTEFTIVRAGTSGSLLVDWIACPEAVVTFVEATGGDQVIDHNGYRVHVFETAGEFVVTVGGEVEIILVGGGASGGSGGGNNALGGAGGAGGFIQASDTVLEQAYNISPGSGGPTTVGNTVDGTNGNTTTALGRTALGGGGGGGDGNGLEGASGGGGRSHKSNGSFADGGPTGSPTQGTVGGDGHNNQGNDTRGGGGGGIAGPGVDGADGGQGGPGIGNTWTGSTMVLSRGGDGARGDQGDGAGAPGSEPGEGGDGGRTDNGDGGAGADGIVLIRYLLDE